MWQECPCGRGGYDPEQYSSCYQCFIDRRADYLSCIWCGRWHSPRFVACYHCRQSGDRDEASIALRQLILHRDGHRCQRCDAREGDPRYDPNLDREVFASLQIDHIKPCARGGTADEWNLQVLCGVCNRTKGAHWSPSSEWADMKTALCRRYFLIAPTYFGDAEHTRFLADVHRYRKQKTW